jgi:hypothetical protein
MTGACVTDLSRRAAIAVSDNSGDVVLPEDDCFDVVVRLWNGAIERQPGLVVRCHDTADVQRSVDCAVRLGIPLAVRGGGHDWSGRALIDNGLIIDMSKIRRVEVDPIRRTAIVAGGATVAEVQRAAARYGLAAAAGTVGPVGFAGLTLGGGYGLLTGLTGLACDNLIAANVVLADGTVVRASADSNPDLWWALRGGGGNFGVVTAMEIALHSVPSACGGLVFFDLEQAREVLPAYAELSRVAPDELTVMAGFVTGASGHPLLLLFPVWSGEPGRAAAELRRVTSLGKPRADLTRQTTPHLLLREFESSTVDGRHYSVQSRWLTAMSNNTIDALIDAIQTATSPYSTILLHHFHGRPTRSAHDSSPFGLRELHHQVEIMASWEPTDPRPEKHHTWAAWVAQALSADAHPGGYPNLLSAEDADRIVAAYGSNVGKLRQVKQRCDPDDVFASAIEFGLLPLTWPHAAPSYREVDYSSQVDAFFEVPESGINVLDRIRLGDQLVELQPPAPVKVEQAHGVGEGLATPEHSPVDLLLHQS